MAPNSSTKNSEATVTTRLFWKYWTKSPCLITVW